MNAVVLGVVTFICTFSAALLATVIRGRLPAPHLSKESQDVVRLGIGLVATMTALLLGLVTAAARSTFDAQDVAIRNSGAAILTLDRHLARYGPETQPTRDLIRRAITARLAEAVAALSVAAAVFLVLELDGPLDGLIKISSKPMEYVLSQLGH